MQTNAQPLPTNAPHHLGLDDVHVWWAALDPPQQSFPKWVELLSDDEKARAQRFHFEIHRLRYIAGRACLRQLLGGYLGLPPAKIEFEYSSLGKPALKTTFDGRVLQFNLSNSANRVLYIFSWQRQVGIDLELEHSMSDEDDFARRFFCASEGTLISSLTGDVKHRTFFELWTCKEALLKAMGSGLSRPINEVEVVLGDGSARLVSIGGDLRLAAEWQLSLFRPAPAYQAALAVENLGWKISYYKANDDFDPDHLLAPYAAAS